MLAKYYRFLWKNKTGQSMVKNSGAAVNIRCMPWKFTSGVLAYGTVITDDMGFDAGETVTNGSSEEGDVQDNSSNLYLGLKGYFEVTTDNASSAGTVDLYLEESDANGTDWPSDQADFDIEEDCQFLGSLSFSAADTRGRNFEL